MKHDNNYSEEFFRERRDFIRQMSYLAAGSLVLSAPSAVAAPAVSVRKQWTVKEIMDLFIKEVTGSPFQNTVDTLKAGSGELEVKGIVTTMFATIPVIKKAISLGANFIIAHEPTFYSHLDKTDWLNNDEVYQFKANLLKDNNIAVWRNHDYIHSHKPDGVYSGLLEKLGWQKNAGADTPWNIDLPSIKLEDLIAHLKKSLDISTLRYIGDGDQVCKKVLLMPGAAGGERQITAISKSNPDVAIVGELQEWETAEYIRDARASGKKTALIVLGHTDSEDAGSIYMINWLSKNVPGIKATHIHSGNPFQFG